MARGRKREDVTRLVAGGLVICATALAGCKLGGSGSARASPTATLAATSTVSGTGTEDEWAMLRARPLYLPTLARGVVCPVLKPHTVSSDFGPVPGAGPVYPAGLTDGVLKYAPEANFSSHEWGGVKVLWAIGPQCQGEALIRGRQIDGTNELRYSVIRWCSRHSRSSNNRVAMWSAPAKGAVADGVGCTRRPRRACSRS